MVTFPKHSDMSRHCTTCRGATGERIASKALPAKPAQLERRRLGQSLQTWGDMPEATPPRRDPPAGPPGPGRPAGKFRGGKFRPPGRPPGGPPRGPPGSPPGTPLGTPPGTPFWGLIYILFVLQGVSGAPPGTPPGDPPGGPPGRPPGGAKSAHFFGYLITLPVGTVWAIFSGPGTAPLEPPIRAIPRQNPPLGRPPAGS